jgi:hypothetical protein
MTSAANVTARTQEEHQALANRLAYQAAADPLTAEWNQDGGAAAIAFIREFPARSRRTPEQAKADRDASVLAVLAGMGAGAGGTR